MVNKNDLKFCYWHEEVVDSENYVCTSHLAEGRCFDCRFEEKDIQRSPDGRIYISAERGSMGMGCCQDFELDKDFPIDRLEKIISRNKLL